MLPERVVAVDWRQRFMNAGARYEAVKRGSLLSRRSTISLDPAAAPAPAAASPNIAGLPVFPIKSPRRR